MVIDLFLLSLAMEAILITPMTAIVWVFFLIYENNMWTVHFKPNNDSQPWSTLDSYYSSVSAILRATWVSDKYFMVKVTDPEGSVIWAN